MDQMIVWALVHHEYATRGRKPPRSDDAYYDNYSDRGERRWRLLGALWPRRERGR